MKKLTSLDPLLDLSRDHLRRHPAARCVNVVALLNPPPTAAIHCVFELDSGVLDSTGGWHPPHTQNPSNPYPRALLVGAHEEVDELGPLLDFHLRRHEMVNVVALLVAAIHCVFELDSGVLDSVALHDLANAAELVFGL